MKVAKQSAREKKKNPLGYDEEKGGGGGTVAEFVGGERFSVDDEK